MLGEGGLCAVTRISMTAELPVVHGVDRMSAALRVGQLCRQWVLGPLMGRRSAFPF